MHIVLGMIRKLEAASLLVSKPCRERNLVVTMIAQRLLNPCSKLAATRLWHTTTLAPELNKVLNRYKTSKHFIFESSDNNFSFQRNAEKIKHEQQPDGIYIVRTNEKTGSLSADNTVRACKSLAQVEQAFRCLKSVVDIRIRPIHLPCGRDNPFSGIQGMDTVS